MTSFQHLEIRKWRAKHEARYVAEIISNLKGNLAEETTHIQRGTEINYTENDLALLIANKYFERLLGRLIEKVADRPITVKELEIASLETFKGQLTSNRLELLLAKQTVIENIYLTYFKSNIPLIKTLENLEIFSKIADHDTEFVALAKERNPSITSSLEVMGYIKNGELIPPSSHERATFKWSDQGELSRQKIIAQGKIDLQLMLKNNKEPQMEKFNEFSAPVIFFDIFGAMTSDHSESVYGNRTVFDENAVSLLKSLLKSLTPTPIIVVTSSQRVHMNMSELIEHVKIQGGKKIANTIMAILDHVNKPRGELIIEFISNYDVEKYAIIDSMTAGYCGDMLQHQVYINQARGITYADIARAIEILNN
jgi:hypothetical protein